MNLVDMYPLWKGDPYPEIAQSVAESHTKLVVLDDDPTGSQTVYGVDVLMDWDPATLTQAFQNPEPVVFVLTNSRSMGSDQAAAVNRDIVRNLKHVSRQTGRDFALLSRSDSTLRGHFPAETDTIQDELEIPVDGVLLIPFFEEGGRVTVDNIHFVLNYNGEAIVPASATEYAQDPTFGYSTSNLLDWVAEKTAGRIPRDEVRSISITDIRFGGPAAVAKKLTQLSDSRVCVVNCLCYHDLAVFTAGLLRAEAQGKRFLYRTAASFVRVRGAFDPSREWYKCEHLPVGQGGGLVVAGSYVGKTSRQLDHLRQHSDMTWVELRVTDVLNRQPRQDEIARVGGALGDALMAGKHAVLFTSRERIEPEGMTFLDAGVLISSALVKVVARLDVRPAWLIAKGGITSSVLATDALQMKTARVLGQALPGIPVWQAGAESRWPGLVYVVFPGNVGDEGAITAVVEDLDAAGEGSAE